MAIEHASLQVVRKPWGVADLPPWRIAGGCGGPGGELPNGKTEALYILSALPDAAVAVGLKRRLPPHELRAPKLNEIAGVRT